MPDQPASFSWRALQLPGRKLLLLVILPPLFTACYYAPQWFRFRAAHELPLLSFERAIPFSTGWIHPYMSMYIMLPLAPLLAIRVEQLRRYVIGMAIMFVSCAVFFLALPIAYPRPPLPSDADWLYRNVVAIDQNINAMPSLHAGLCVYTLLFAARILRDMPRRTYVILLAVGWIWTIVILYGTLATKQHYFVDLPAGGLVAWVSHVLAWRMKLAAETSDGISDPALASSRQS
jgi:hypothetical protein